FETDPLAADLPVLGTGSVDLHLRSTAPDVDVEVNITELRPDGSEVYVQSGWLRASHRQEAPGSTALEPFHTHLASDAADLPPDEFVPIRVELFPVAHVLRAGSRLRLTVEAPGGDRPFWRFASIDAPGAVNDIGHSVGRPSKVTLPVVADPGAPAGLPNCPADGGWSLRGQPCRDEVPSRAPVDVAATVDVEGAEAAAADDVGDITVTWSPPATAQAVTGYTVGVVPTGETFPVDPATTSLAYDLGDGPPPATELAFVVTASFADGDGPAGNASLQVPGPHGYPDLGRGVWNVAALDWVDAYEIVDGYPDGTFRGGENVTRAQLVVWLWKMMGRPNAAAPADFSDVHAGAWYRQALDWAVENGLVTGYPDGTFRANDPVTRAQLTMWLWAMAGSTPGSPPHGFADVPPGRWFEAGLNWLVANAIATGYPDNTFRGNDPASRGQMAFWVFNLAGAPAAFS
ncbi:MAG: S-layer homology domain-containing protein, partial [Actinomycetota bacterium]